MADTMGLGQTRSEWADAVAKGETDLPHADWYRQKYGAAGGATETLSDVLAKKEKVPKAGLLQRIFK